MNKLRLLFYCLVIISCKTFGQQKGYVNPSAVYCERMGYKYEIRKDKNGNDVGVCILPNNTVVNAWDFYRGKVAQEYSYCAKMGYLTETERKDSAGIITECAVCVKKLKNGKEERISMPELMKRDEGPLVNGCKKKDSNPIWEKAAYDKNFKYNKLLPNTFDWRNVNGHTYIGGIRDQGSCGSCYSFGANAAAEGTFNFVTGKFDADCIDLSESFIIWCLGSISPYSDHFSGCGGADYSYMELQALCDSGVCYESSFPYVQSNPGVCTHWNDPRVKMKEWHRVPCSDTTAIKTAIMNYGVVDAAVYVTTSFQNYSGGVYSDANTDCSATPCYNTTTNHAISLVGWGHDPVQGLYWILRNSWGGSWGESGYMRLKWNSSRILCEVCYLEYYYTPTVTTFSASNIGNTYATLNGKVNPNGKLTNYYFEYGTTTSYGNSTSLTPAGSGTSPINVSADIISLATGTKYFFRIVASNADSISYGESMTFTPGMPTITTTAASDITKNSCISGGNVLSQGATPVTARGVCYSTLPNPTITDNHTSDGSGAGSFISTINSLNPNTTYHIRAYATNSIITVYGNDLIFRTKCETLNLPYIEGFENGALPDCWSQEAGPPTWQFISGNGGNNPASAHGGNFNALLKDKSSASNTNKLISPSLNLTGTTNPILRFWHTQEFYSPDQDELRIYYRTSATGEWNLIATYTNNIPSWTQEVISLPSPGGDYYIAFEGDAKYGYGVCIDDIEVLDFICSTSYAQASNFGSADITMYSMNISWTRGNGNEVLVVANQSNPVNANPVNGKIYSANAVFGSGEQIGTGNYVIYKGTGTQVSVSNLLSNTTYYFSVYEYSSAGCYTIPALTGNATTIGCSSYLLPFTEDFENSTFPPECWTSYRGANGLGTVYDWERITTSTYNSSAGASYVNYESVTGGSAEDWLVTPKISIPGGPTFNLSFYERQTFSNDYGSQYYIKVSTTSQTDRATFVDVSNYGETTFGTTYTQRNIDLSSYAGQDIYLAFVMVQNDGDDWYIDNININNTPPITNVTWTGTTSTDWNTGSNWNDGNVPTVAKDLIIPAGCTYYPTVDETASCNNLTVQNGGSIIITDGANLAVKGNLAIGSGASGSFAINGGSCTVTGDIFTESGCNVNISGGTFNFSNWARSSSNYWAAGYITLSGGTINASGSIRFSSIYVTGTMNGPFIFNVGDDFYISGGAWSIVTGGTINLLGTGTAPFNFWSPNSTTSSVAYNLNINAPGNTYFLCRSDGNNNLIINNNLAITAGTTQTFYGSYRLSTFSVNGNLTIENGATLNCDGTNDPDIRLGGNWINNGGSFIPGSNSVILTGTNQTISGANTFYNLIKSVATAAQLTFKTGTANKTTVTNTLTLQGSAGQLLSLRSFINGTQWEIDPQSTRNLSYLDVQDSKNTNATNIQACSLINSGNNTKWDFLAAAAAGTITGTLTIVPGQTGVIYSVPAITNASGYIWSLPNGATITDGFNTRSITVSFSLEAQSGDITVQGTSSCGNGAVSPAFHVTVGVGIPETNSVDYIILYPDPVTHILTIESSSEIKSIGISGITGNVIMKRTNLNLKMFQIDMDAYFSGVYILNIILRDNPQVPVIRKIIKN